MTKHVILIVGLSFVAIFFKTQLTHILDGLIYIHNFIAITLHMIFTNDPLGRIIQDMISLLAIPIIGGVIIALAFWLVKRAAMPHTMVVVWIVWLVLVITMLAQSNLPTNGVGESPAQTAQRNSQRATY